MPDNETRISAGKLELRTVDGKPVIGGYAAVFNSPSENLGGFRERIAPHAFATALGEAQDVRALVDHDPSRIIGRTKAGTLKLAEDDHGLRVEIHPPDTSVGRDIVESIKRGDVDGMSFAFSTIKDSWDHGQTPPMRTLEQVNLYDVSPVTYPAYPATSVALRSLEASKAAVTPPGRPTDTARRRLALDKSGDGDTL